LAKLIQICQKNSTKLNTVIKSQEKLETMLIEQKNQISEIMSRLDRLDHHAAEVEVEDKRKNKNKSKTTNDFYQVNICNLCVSLHCSVYIYL
jgi:hypothetical protein